MDFPGLTLIAAGAFWPSCVLFALLVLERFEPMIDATTLSTVVTTTVVLSVFAHGVTAGPGSRWYASLAQRVGRLRPDCPELKPVPEMPTRLGMIQNPSPVRRSDAE